MKNFKNREKRPEIPNQEPKIEYGSKDNEIGSPNLRAFSWLWPAGYEILIGPGGQLLEPFCTEPVNQEADFQYKQLF